jgi:hypothetical protein
MKSIVTSLVSLVAAGAVCTCALAPVSADAQSQAQINHRQKSKNDWRNLAYGAGAVGLFGLLKHDNTLTFAGAAGAAYSAYRYEQDRKSHSKMRQARAAMFSRRSFWRSGHHYVRQTSWKNGQKYYYFKRVS